MESDHRAGPTAGFELLGQEFYAARGQSGRLDPIERGWVAALLDVPQDRLPGVEQLPALFLEQRCDESGGVDGVGILVADDQAEPFPGAEPSARAWTSAVRSSSVMPSSGR